MTTLKTNEKLPPRVILAARLKMQGLTQAQAAEEVGLSASHVRKVLAGLRTSRRALAALAELVARKEAGRG